MMGVGRATTTEQSLEGVQCETKSEYIIERMRMGKGTY